MIEVRQIDMDQTAHNLMIWIPWFHQCADTREHIDQRQEERIRVYLGRRAFHDLEYGGGRRYGTLQRPLRTDDQQTGHGSCGPPGPSTTSLGPIEVLIIKRQQ